jgi:ATP-dependent RNA helicase DDX49/DBP8
MTNRELAIQIYEQFASLGSTWPVKPTLIIGGSEMRLQAIALSQRPNIIIATPGRLADHIRTSGEDTIRGLRRIKYLVLDEADRLLSTGHGSMLPDLNECLSVFPSAQQRSTLLFTATMTPVIRQSKDNPRALGRPDLFVSEIETESPATPESLQQKYIKVPPLQKESYLDTLLLTPANISKVTIIFCNRTATAQLLERMLKLLDYRVTALHSKLMQSERTSNLTRFRASAARILVATDVAARGLDIPQVGLVINYDVPRDPEDYIHRVGRTARAGRSGISITFICPHDVELLGAIEHRVGLKMDMYVEDGVNIESRVIKNSLKQVSEKKREALLQIEQGREVNGRRSKRMKRLAAV